MIQNFKKIITCLSIISLMIIGCTDKQEGVISIENNNSIVLIGNNLASRMMDFGYFETEMHMRYPDSNLFIRNIADPGNTPGFRPHSSRNLPWAFPGAEKFYQDELGNKSGSIGFFPSEDEWLTNLEADIIIAFFGYNESFKGEAGIQNFKDELHAFIQHTKNQKYNRVTPPKLILVSPIAFEDLSTKMDLPNGVKENKNLKLYANAMFEVATQDSIAFIDVFNPSKKWYEEEGQMTVDGFQLNDTGYKKLAKLVNDEIFGKKLIKSKSRENLVHNAVMEKNWFWHNEIKLPNGVHAWGRRYDPFGPDNYPYEKEKINQMIANRDTLIWNTAQGKKTNLKIMDSKTKELPVVETNYKDINGPGNPEYSYGKDALEKLKVAKGYKLELFASEKEFPDLANPVQLSFDNAGRLWVATMPSYPHYKPGDSKPDDKLLILEDTNNDGKADKQIIFAKGLHLPLGFEFASEGVYATQGMNLVLLKDTDGDDKADSKEIVLSGFDDHDTHHGISAYAADPSGAIYMAEGVFLHTNVETAYGPVRGTNGGFYRYSPQRNHLERTAQLPIPNPWGIAFDEWGQPFFAHTSGPDMTWMMPGTIKSRYGQANPLPENLIEKAHRVRPTSGLEFIHSSHFPDEVQGDILINNTIGFLGTKQHSLVDDPNSSSYLSKHRTDLISSEDTNFRPVDMEFAPDGSLYFVDWHNVLVGHMQHNARDPLRDHAHGRIYRLTYPSRPLVKPAKIVNASIEELLENLKLPEFRIRYRTRRELRARNAGEVLKKLELWVSALDKTNPRYEHHVLEALWVTWGLNKVNKDILIQMLAAKDFRARAAAVKVLRYTGHQITEQPTLLMTAAKDKNPRVRLEAFVAASWLPKEIGLPIIETAGQMKLDSWMQKPYEAAISHIQGINLGQVANENTKTDLVGVAKELFTRGEEIYNREGFCVTCHQPDGLGLNASQFPPLAGQKWVTGSKERLIKLTLKGMMGPLKLSGKTYPGQVPMTPFEGMLNDEEVAAVLTFVRNTFGNKAEPILPEKVKEVRNSIKNKKGFYTAENLLKEHPMK